MQSMQMESLERELRKLLRRFPVLFLTGFALALVAGYGTAASALVLAIFMEIFSPRIVTSTLCLAMLLASGTYLVFGRDGGRFECIRRRLMSGARRVADISMNASMVAMPVFLGAGMVLALAQQWRNASIIVWFCLTLVCVGVVPKLSILALDMIPSPSAGKLIENGRLLGMLQFCAALLMSGYVISYPN